MSWVSTFCDPCSGNIDEKFIEAVEFTRKLIRSVVLCAQKYNNDILKFEKAYNKAIKTRSPLLIFDTNVPWKELLFKHDMNEWKGLRYVIYPHFDNSRWNLQVIPDAPKSFGNLYPLPKHWYGLNGNDLVEASNIPGAIFCHKNGFIASWKEREQAINAANEAILQLKL